MTLLILVSLMLISMIAVLFTETNLVLFDPKGKTSNQASVFDIIWNKISFLTDAYPLLIKDNLFKGPQGDEFEEEPNSDLLEIDRKINLLNKKLEQNLSTLVYIFKMESNFRLSDSLNHLEDLIRLRKVLRKNTLKLTNELNYQKELRSKFDSDQD